MDILGPGGHPAAHPIMAGPPGSSSAVSGNWSHWSASWQRLPEHEAQVGSWRQDWDPYFITRIQPHVSGESLTKPEVPVSTYVGMRSLGFGPVNWCEDWQHKHCCSVSWVCGRQSHNDFIAEKLLQISECEWPQYQATPGSGCKSIEFSEICTKWCCCQMLQSFQACMFLAVERHLSGSITSVCSGVLPFPGICLSYIVIFRTYLFAVLSNWLAGWTAIPFLCHVHGIPCCFHASWVFVALNQMQGGSIQTLL